MWSRDRSVLLSLVATRVIAVLALALAVALPFIMDADFFEARYLLPSAGIKSLMAVYYCFLVPAGVALFSLDRLLVAIRAEQVFTPRNVSHLRVITWCCFFAGVVLLAASLVSIVFFALAILAAFFGVILRVVKNLFAAAVALQVESDFTI